MKNNKPLNYKKTQFKKPKNVKSERFQDVEKLKQRIQM